MLTTADSPSEISIPILHSGQNPIESLSLASLSNRVTISFYVLSLFFIDSLVTVYCNRLFFFISLLLYYKFPEVRLHLIFEAMTG